MLYMFTPLEEHPDKGFGAMADSFEEAAKILSKSENTLEKAHLPINYLRRHAIELFLKSIIILLHTKFEIPYGDNPDTSTPQVLVNDEWKLMNRIHSIRQL